MGIDIINFSSFDEVQKYKELLNNFKNLSPYYLPAFFSQFSGKRDSLICFYLRKQNDLILLPGLLSSIPDLPDYYDFISPYGYSGPIYTSGINGKDLELFWREIDQWHKSNNIVSEFIRFSLNSNYLGYTGELILSLWNIKGIILTEEEQWRNFDRKVRKNINRAIKENLKFKIYYGKDISKKVIEDFYSIYIHTMKRNNANTYFTYENFINFHEINPDRVIFCFVYDKNICVSTEMGLLSDDTVYSFLGGTLDFSFPKRPNDFLKFNLINWMRNNDKKFYVLGGGLSKSDGIFKFKKSFFPNDVLPFYTGRKIINYDVYYYLEDLFYKKLQKQGYEILINENDFFPVYKKPLSYPDIEK